MLFLSGHDGPEVAEIRDHPLLGLLARPGTYRPARIAAWPRWAADNGAYFPPGQPRPFDAPRWSAWLERLPAGALFAVAPDVPYDWAGTLELSPQWFDRIRAAGIPLAMALQDGSTPATVPWSELEVAFLGGSTAWKESEAAHLLADAAHDRGLAVHMGRANTRRRLALAASWECESADGTTLARGARRNLPSLLRWLEELQDPQLALPAQAADVASR